MFCSLLPVLCLTRSSPPLSLSQRSRRIVHERKKKREKKTRSKKHSSTYTETARLQARNNSQTGSLGRNDQAALALTDKATHQTNQRNLCELVVGMPPPSSPNTPRRVQKSCQCTNWSLLSTSLFHGSSSSSNLAKGSVTTTYPNAILLALQFSCELLLVHPPSSRVHLALVAKVPEMLAVSPAGCAGLEERAGGAAGVVGMEGDALGAVSDLDFDFSVDDIDFGDFFLRLEDGDALPDLEVDPADIFTEFEEIATGGNGVTDQEVPSVHNPSPDGAHVAVVVDPCTGVLGEENPSLVAAPAEGKGECNLADEAAAGRNGEVAAAVEEKSTSSTTSSSQEAESRHKSSSNSSHGKKKAKVDWTPELHRRFVQAVEQLGIDKAVPSRILEIMGIDSLTRHNIASHLQKYRSHRKHMLAREAEAASWTQRRQMYATGGSATAVKRPDPNAWTVPTIGFPPPPPAPPSHPTQHFARPLHVWGHPTPTVDSPRVPMWPRHLVPRTPTPPWAPPPADPAFWHHHPYMRGPGHMPSQVMAMPMPTARFPAPPVRGVLPPCPAPLYRPLVPPTLANKTQQDTQLQLHTQPSNESIDAAIGDVLTKPWLPLPLGLKPPSVDSVMGELQRQGVGNVPPACG